MWVRSLSGLVEEIPTQVRGLRGHGYLAGVQLARDPTTYVAALRERDLLAPLARGNVIRLLPPLNATAAGLAQVVAIFRATLTALA